MRAQSARALKLELLAGLADAVADVARAYPEAAPGGAQAAALTRGAVGVAPRPGGDAALALRLPVLTPATRALAARFDEAASGELDVRVTGRVTPQVLRADPLVTEPDPRWTGRARPLRAGVSVSHPLVTAGTLGAFVTVGEAGDLHLLSNSHVLALSGAARPGDPTLQPGVADGGRDPQDRVAALTDFVPLSADAVNTVDAALSVLDDGVTADLRDLPGGPLAGALAEGPENLPADLLVEKSGRTTGYTRGRVSALELDGLRIGYEIGQQLSEITFDDQIEVEGLDDAPFSRGGDSGSLILTSTGRLGYALLFAGSETGGPGGHGLTYGNPFAAVLAQLGLTLVTGSEDGSAGTGFASGPSSFGEGP